MLSVAEGQVPSPKWFLQLNNSNWFWGVFFVLFCFGSTGV
jgi:hypothetical protein